MESFLVSSELWSHDVRDMRLQATLTMATKWRRFMPGLLALVSASLSKEEILNPAAFPA